MKLPIDLSLAMETNMLANSTKTEQFCKVGKFVVSTEIKAIQALLPRIGQPFALATSRARGFAMDDVE